MIAIIVNKSLIFDCSFINYDVLFVDQFRCEGENF